MGSFPSVLVVGGLRPFCNFSTIGGLLARGNGKVWGKGPEPERGANGHSMAEPSENAFGFVRVCHRHSEGCCRPHSFGHLLRKSPVDIRVVGFLWVGGWGGGQGVRGGGVIWSLGLEPGPFRTGITGPAWVHCCMGTNCGLLETDQGNWHANHHKWPSHPHKWLCALNPKATVSANGPNPRAPVSKRVICQQHLCCC